MASSKVMASNTSTNSDLARQPSTYSLTIGDLQNDQTNKNLGSMSMEEFMRIYGDNPPSSSEMITNAADGESSLSRQGSFPLPKNVGTKTVDEVWKEISAAKVKDSDEMEGEMEGQGEGGGEPFNEMTLEEFLTKAGAVREEDMKIPQMVGPVHGFVVDPALDARYSAQPTAEGSGSILWLGNGGDRAGGGRGKRRAVLEPIDKAAQQRQRRMIKNRESAARSRERKQAYTVELETLVTQLEEENARMQREQAEKTQERYMQLMENIIPVEDKRKPRRTLKRVKSTIW